MTIVNSVLPTNLILTFALPDCLAEAEQAQAATEFGNHETGSAHQPALILAIGCGISLRSNATSTVGPMPVYALGWEPPATIDAAKTQQQLIASHFGSDSSQQHLMTLDPDENSSGENLLILMRRGIAAGHPWLTLLRTPDAVRLVTADTALPQLPGADTPATALAQQLRDRLREIAAGTSSHRIARTLITPETVAAILAVHDTADGRQRSYLLGMPLPLLADLAWRILGGSR